MVKKIKNKHLDQRVEILSRICENQKGTFKELINQLKKDGFLRIYHNSELKLLEEIEQFDKNKKHTIDVIIDRLRVKEDSDSRLYDSIELGLQKKRWHHSIKKQYRY